MKTEENPCRIKVFDAERQKLDSTQFYNQRLKFYPMSDGTQRLAEIVTFSSPRFNPEGVNRRDERLDASAYDDFKNEFDAYLYDKYTGLVDEYVYGGIDEETNKCSSLRALNRAKKRAFDLMACNLDCNLFVTFTLDAAKISRDDWTQIIPKLNTWLYNRVRRNGLKYVLVPEYHKDGKNIHFHGVMNETALELTNSGKISKGRTIYNVESWKYGFSTAKRIQKGYDNHIAVTKYVFKYMTKTAQSLRENPEKDIKIGGRYFLHGGALSEPLYEYRRAAYADARGYETKVGDALGCKIENFV